MKSVRMFFFAAMVLFLCACPATGTIHFNDGLTHDIDYEINGWVYVDYQTPYMYTTVNLLVGGSADFLCSYNSGQVNISGGSIVGLESLDSGQVGVSDGSIGFLNSYGFSHADISGGQIYELYGFDSSQVNVSGGSVGFFFVCGSSCGNISGGQIQYDFGSCDSGRLNISGGSMGGLDSYNSSLVNISGGSIGNNLVLFDQSMIQIFGSDFAVDGQPFGYGELTSIFGGSPWDEPLRHLTGTLLSGELFDNDFYIGDDARIVLTIPEPASAVILGLGSFFFALRRRRR